MTSSGAGHYPIADVPDWTADRIIAFFRDAPRDQAAGRNGGDGGRVVLHTRRRSSSRPGPRATNTTDPVRFLGLRANTVVCMLTDPRILKTYVDHFLPREVVGPVIIVFSLEGVIDGIFGLYVPDQYATLGWGLVFALSLVLVAYWGTVDEPAVEELRDRIEEIQDDDNPADDRS